MATVKALPIDVYRNRQLGDCTNGGVSSKYDTLYLACDNGYKDVDENDERLVKMVTRVTWCDNTYTSIEPYQPCPKGMIGWMDGGNVGYTTDGRFDFKYPLKIHDRCETQKQYDMLSR